MVIFKQFCNFNILNEYGLHFLQTLEPVCFFVPNQSDWFYLETNDLNNQLIILTVTI